MHCKISLSDQFMAEKTSTLMLKVDLDCDQCHNKIRKTLCKLQHQENFQTIAYDKTNNAVVISGPFNPDRLSEKLKCKAGKVIKDIQIINPNISKPADIPPAKNVKEVDEKDEAEKTVPKPQPNPPRQMDDQSKPSTSSSTPAIVYSTGAPAWPARPFCYCRPYNDSYNWGCNCGGGYGVPPTDPCNRNCHFLSEENPWCAIM